MQESSVAFNLAELMRLEEQRVQQRDAEARAALEARHRALEQRERAARAAQDEAERQAEAQARQERMRQEQTREEAVQRVRLELEASERLEQERRAMQHAVELERVRQPSGQVRLAGWLNAVLGVGLVGCVALYFGVLRPALESTRTLAAQAQALAQDREQELDELRSAARQAAPIRAEAAAPVPAPAIPQPPAREAGSSRIRPRPTVQTSTTPRVVDADELGDLDLDSDDPFDDSSERQSPRRRERRR